MKPFSLFVIGVLLVTSTVFGATDPSADQATAEKDVRTYVGQRYKDYVNPHPVTVHGDAVLPVVEELLAAPGNLSTLEISKLLAIIRRVNSPYPPLRPHVLPYLLSAEDNIRWRAVMALTVIGAKEDAPALVALLWDPDFSVRAMAVRALGALGEESALLALEIWQKQVAEADRERPPERRWLYPQMLEDIRQAKEEIQGRIENDQESE